MRYKRDIFYLLLILLLGLIFWSQALEPGKVLISHDLSSEIVPKRHFWLKANGFALWSPYAFLGTAYAANPQSESFYPFNFIFLIFGAERGLVYYIVFHHLFFLLTLYLAVRRLGFNAEASLIAAIGFAFGGYSVSSTNLIMLLSTITWLPLLIIFLKEAVDKSWLKWGLLLGLVITIQMLAGEAEIAAMSWMIAIFSVALSPKAANRPKNLAKMFGAMALGVVGGVILSLPQIALTMELIPISNRAEGVDLSGVLSSYFSLPGLKLLLVPNYVFRLTSGNYYGLGFFNGYPYFYSSYLGISLLLLSLLCFAGNERVKPCLWLVMAVFGLVMMMGGSLPVYGFFYNILPGFKFFRIPSKFFLLFNFSVAILAAYGYGYLSTRNRFFPAASLVSLFTGLIIAILLIAYPVKVQELGNKYQDIINYLFLRSILRISALFMIMLGLIFMAGKIKMNLAGLAMGCVIFSDFFFAHHLLNPATDADFYRPNSFIQELRQKNRDRIIPPRIFTVQLTREETMAQRWLSPLEFYAMLRDSLEYFWNLYFDLDNIREMNTFCYRDVSKFRKVLARVKLRHAQLVLARAGVEYFYSRDTGFSRLPGAFARVVIFYGAKTMNGQDEIINIWSDPNFPVRKTLLIEDAESVIEPAQGLEISEPAKIVRYENEEVEIEAVAKKSGWLMLLDSYYPGWRAFVDGKQVKIYRADGFFRAVPIPAGKHLVSFDYHPAAFYRSVKISAAGFLVWLALLMFSWKGKGGWQDKSGRG